MGADKIHRWVFAGNRHHQVGELNEAERLYKRALRRDPANPDALHFLGVLAYQRGDAEAGIESIRKALRRQPEYADAHCNLGRILTETGHHDEAIAALREALRQRPELVEARFNLGVCLRKTGFAEQAIAEIEQALEYGYSSAQAYYQLGLACAAAGRAEAACMALAKALELDSTLTAAYERLGVVLYSLGRIEEAGQVYSRWLAAEPTSVKARHMRSACEGVDVPDRAADAYITELFDAFASTFDEKLAKLDYRAPALVAEAVDSLGLPPNGADVLDAGCGTGLCGPLLAPHASMLVGVDLSGGMIAEAQALDVYDELAVGELVEFMASRPQGFDLIVSADTLVYFGKLDDVLSTAAGCLRPGGALVFTVESLPEASAPFALHPHGRYGHSRSYVESTIAQAGLALRRIGSVVLRQEKQRPVDGLLVVAVR